MGFEGGVNFVMERFSSAGKVEMGFEDPLHFVMKKLNELWLLIVNSWDELWLLIVNSWDKFLGWADKVFPPETRADQINHWVKVALPYVIPAVCLTLLLCCCYKCCLCCCRGGGRGGVKMMKAPGRNIRMPRSIFESDPKGYFVNLRANPGDHLC